MSIAIIGLGYVGLPLARWVATKYVTVGFDINTERITQLKRGFDKTGESNFIIPVSDSQAYRQFGNSVVVPVINEIAKYMLPFINASSPIFQHELRICA